MEVDKGGGKHSSELRELKCAFVLDITNSLKGTHTTDLERVYLCGEGHIRT